MRPPRTTTKAGTPGHAPRGRRAHAGPPAAEAADRPFGTPPAKARARGNRRHLRPRTVRAKVVGLLMVPVVSLLALWAYATVTTAQDVARLRQSQRVDAELRTPVAAAVTALQAERTAAVRYATAPGAGDDTDLRGLAARTDGAVAELRLGGHNTVADSEELPAGVSGRLSAFVTGVEHLRALRTAVLDRKAGWDRVYAQYTKTIGAAFAVDGALTGIQRADVGSDARVLLEFSRAAEALAQEDTLLGSARTAAQLQGERLRLFGAAVTARRTLTEVAVADLPVAQRTAWQGLAGSGAYTALGAAEDKIIAAGPGSKPADASPQAAWNAAHARVQDGMQGIAANTGRAVAGRADPFTRGLLSPAGSAVLLGLAAVAASLVISVRIGRGLVVELVSLRNDALEIARRKLPEAMRRLRAGEEIDIQAEAPVGPPAEDETGQVSEALTTVHRAALHAAVERAELASGISGVFVNLARRSQVLVHRQLSLLDSMERRSEDPNELSDLFRLDHLTTRMRRHAESLIILSGAAPGRAWRMPVSLTNVVRAAVSEIEDYARVEVRQLPEAHVIGAAVADLTHLLAELVENAAQFSPPHTRVRVTGEPVGNGYALEIEDRGLGMGAETLAEANRRIEQSEALDLFDSDRLGLFVVSRLASRHDVKVHLRTSPYGGTTAVVLVPTALLHTGATERSSRQGEQSRRDPDREYARVPGASPHQEAVATRSDRPALAATAPGLHGVVDEPRPHGTGDETPPPGVTALRLHRPPDDSESSDNLPRRVRQASLAPQLRQQRPEEPAQETARHSDERRTPELVRDRMAAYRAGWARGGGRQPGRGAAPEPETGSDLSEGDPA
ncbi:sensor histidine kinase [Streptomyces barringtoniae]|uniref:sensor histidine kinase n=1 Tax=Streptomyces barringtoniae TaxID=2892029 RepID=UPI001E407690|nr:nitrate- and nitrite sensing domain-containing protein [Streptomyces barringtoniae]MCC5474249.1 nitrate- and nitrite sensing domain-containing protein [Streptomyces barringtoniae]